MAKAEIGDKEFFRTMIFMWPYEKALNMDSIGEKPSLFPLVGERVEGGGKRDFFGLFPMHSH